MSRLLARGALVAVGVLVALVTLEIALRRAETHVVAEGRRDAVAAAFVEHDAAILVEHTSKGRRLVPNASVVIHNHHLARRDIPIRINSHGFRGPEPSDEPGVFRILILGDSITWSDFLPEEESFVAVAERTLHAAGATAVELVNGGVGDFGTREEIELLVERGLGLEPDVVVLAFYLNDSRPPWGFPGELGERGWLRRRSLLIETVTRELVLWRWLRERGVPRTAWMEAARSLDWQSDPEALRKLAAEASYDWGSAWDPASWTRIETEIGRLVALSREHDFRLAAVVFPVAFQVLAGFVEDTPQRRAAALFARFGIPALDLLPLLRPHRGKRLFYDQCHPTPEGSRLIGEAIAGFLRREGLAG